MNVAHRWSQIQGLPDQLHDLVDPELPALRRVWLEQKSGLETAGRVADFTQRLVREYAIEGGIIERAYTLDRGVTETLIERGIDAALIPHHATNRDPQYVAQVIQAHQQVVEGVFELVRGGRPLTTSVMKEMHAALLQYESTVPAVDSLGRIVEVPLLKGAYKKFSNNPQRPDKSIHEYCPPEHVESEMDQLIAMHSAHEVRKVPTEVAAAWLHHAFTQIHPFQDGNGRIARLIASYVLIKDNYFPLTLVDRQDRESHIEALEAADSGDLKPLVRLFSAVQRRTFVKVLGIASTVQRRAGIDQIISAAKQALASRKESHYFRLDQAKRTARSLHSLTVSNLESVAQILRRDLAALSPEFHFRVDSEVNEGQRRHYFRGQVVEVAESLDYFANISLYHDWVRLIIKTGDQSEILVSFHGIGSEYSGVLVASVGFYRRVATDEGDRETTRTASPAQSVFQINYLEEPGDAEKRFEQWLQGALTGALEIWRTGL